MRATFLAPAAIAVLVGALTAAACAPRAAFYAPVAALGNTVQVRVFDAYARGDHFVVKTIVTNISGQPMVVDRDGFQLKLPSGELVPRSAGVTDQHKPYPLMPGAGREVFLEFRAPNELLEALPSAMLVVGGITVGAEPAPHAVGEIPLTHAPAQ